jgi:catalase
VHTFRLVTEDGSARFVKWHWISRQGKASLVWDEAQHLAGKNADFHRQDLWEAIESGYFPEWELNIQVIDEEEALAFGFDVLDPTKIIPVELAPLQPIGVMRLDANPVNYFSEVEQIMVCRRSNAYIFFPRLINGVVSTWPYRPRHRLHRRSAPSGPHLLLSRHAAQPSRRA